MAAGGRQGLALGTDEQPVQVVPRVRTRSASHRADCDAEEAAAGSEAVERGVKTASSLFPESLVAFIIPHLPAMEPLVVAADADIGVEKAAEFRRGEEFFAGAV